MMFNWNYTNINNNAHSVRLYNSSFFCRNSACGNLWILDMLWVFGGNFQHRDQRFNWLSSEIWIEPSINPPSEWYTLILLQLQNNICLMESFAVCVWHFYSNASIISICWIIDNAFKLNLAPRIYGSNDWVIIKVFERMKRQGHLGSVRTVTS